MIKAEQVALVLLAAGRSVRFGDADKLAEPFLTQPLGLHVVTALEGVMFAARIAVVGATELDYAERGYTVIHNDDPREGLSRSVMLGVQAARPSGCAGILIALADMPRVTAAHIYRMLDYADGPDAIIASSNSEHPTPPVLFGAAHFDRLETLEGQAGARDLVRAGHHMVTSPDELVDIDTPEELAALRAKYGAHGG
jgi:molybdenum cofactor cytidylyltransferase